MARMRSHLAVKDEPSSNFKHKQGVLLLSSCRKRNFHILSIENLRLVACYVASHTLDLNIDSRANCLWSEQTSQIWTCAWSRCTFPSLYEFTNTNQFETLQIKVRIYNLLHVIKMHNKHHKFKDACRTEYIRHKHRTAFRIQCSGARANF